MAATAVEFTGYEVECSWCHAELGVLHEFMAGTTPSGVVVQTFFGTVHRCDTVTDEDADVFIGTLSWGGWSKDRHRQSLLASASSGVSEDVVVAVRSEDDHGAVPLERQAVPSVDAGLEDAGASLDGLRS